MIYRREAMQYILTFESEYSEQNEFEHPRGYSICKVLKSILTENGFHTHSIENYRDIAWSMDCEINGKQIYFFVGYLGTKNTEWQLVVCSDVGLLRRLLGYKDQNERLQLAMVIHSILSNDNRVSNLKWFDRYSDTSKDVAFRTPSDIRFSSDHQKTDD
jgi:hypothetical protein